ncbi:phosphoribosylamine--glycine ligase [Candidatus Marinamargulisbacteria bacterium SCGC AG-410-N11]|nr:phosphoribosylamine--glycine ligase [Candidatus Marinamargulisbacteria bacterium SCGC AG-410-N11]
MKKYNIPTAHAVSFKDYKSAYDYLLKKNNYPIVIKADGLAAGKGVTVATSFDQANQALEDCFINHVFKEAGSQVLIEDFLQGEEASIFAFCDGKTILPMVPAQDHKAIFDGDKGPNTGGMGAYSPAPIVTNSLFEKIKSTVFDRALEGFQAEGIDYRGILYAGLMIHNDDVSIVEFNARFGDPETQVVLPRLNTDLVDIFLAITNQTLDQISLDWRSESAVCIVMASGGYPGSYQKGNPIAGLANINQLDDVHVIHAGTSKDNDQILTNGGRVLGVVGIHRDLQEAIAQAYEGVDKISFDQHYFRKDIGAKAIKSISK